MVDFRLAAIADETTSRTAIADGKTKGTTRWIASEFFATEEFEYTSKFTKQLPSKDTNIHAIGMTILR